MSERARKIDAVKLGTDGYWSRIIERAARSFENYVINKMQLNGYDNDYLANVLKVDSFGRDSSRFPYLLDEELAPISEAFDKLFSTIETKETDAGTALFSNRNNTTNLDTAKRRMDKFVTEFEAGKLKDSNTQILGDTPTVMQLLGTQNLLLQIDGARVRKVLNGAHSQDISAETLRQITDGIYIKIPLDTKKVKLNHSCK